MRRKPKLKWCVIAFSSLGGYGSTLDVGTLGTDGWRIQYFKTKREALRCWASMPAIVSRAMMCTGYARLGHVVKYKRILDIGIYLQR